MMSHQYLGSDLEIIYNDLAILNDILPEESKDFTMLSNMDAFKAGHKLNISGDVVTDGNSESQVPEEKFSGAECEKGMGEDIIATFNQIRYCQVCNDYASGYHYGAWSCEGCKAFFKRSIYGQMVYICPATNTCTIDRNRRKSCQACRLKRCYDVGMTQIYIRKNKTKCKKVKSVKCHNYRIESNLLPRKTNSLGANIQNSIDSNSSPSEVPSDYGLDSTQLSTSPDEIPTHKNFSPNVMQTFLSLDERYVEERDDDIISILINYEKCQSKYKQQNFSEAQELFALEDRSMITSFNHVLSVRLITNLENELIGIIEWVRHIPGYFDIPLKEQVHLIEASWFELILLNIAYASKSCKGDGICVGDGIHLSKKDFEDTTIPPNIYETLFLVAARFKDLKVTLEEFVCLKLLALFNTDILVTKKKERLAKMAQEAMKSLQLITNQKCKLDSHHLIKLVLLFTHIRHIMVWAVGYFTELKFNNKHVKYGPLVNEMLEKSWRKIYGVIQI